MFDEFDPRWRGTPELEARTIRQAIRQHSIGRSYGRYDRIRFGAYNRAEVDAIAALLTADERALVTFTWWSWGAAAR